MLSRTKNSVNKDIKKYFDYAYKELSKTLPNIPDYEVVMKKMHESIKRTKIMEVNTRNNATTPTIEWFKSYSWILIGGQAMDRGFTIEGLTVTFMPRNEKSINADTLEQRGRFFGHKKKYLGFCRVFLKKNSFDAFTEYVHHEETIHKRLIELIKKGVLLKDWPRIFYLDPKMNMCRRTILIKKIKKGIYKQKWFAQNYFPSTGNANHNNKLINELNNFFDFDKNSYLADSKRSIHKCKTDLSLKEIMDKFLSKYKVGPNINDIENYNGLMFQLQEYLDAHNDEECVVYHMNFNKVGYRSESKSIPGRITNLFGGPSEDLIRYKGDRNLRDKDKITIQIHCFSRDADKTIDPYHMIGVWVPEKFSKYWATQIQNHE